MPQVTIQGSLTPSVHLARGKQVTVELTPLVEKLLRNGFVVLVKEDAPVTPQLEVAATDQPPARNATTEAWEEFLTIQGVDFPQGATRGELIELWDTQAGGGDG